MKPYDFNYIRATSITHALELLEESNGGAKILAGGQSLITTLNMRLSAPELLIDVNDLEDMQGISMVGDRLRIGALTRHVEIQQSEAVVEHVPLLKLAIDHVAHAAIRNRGTHGGSIAFADPAAEIPACTVALDASFTIRNLKGERQVSAREFFHDLYETELQEDDILVAIDYPLNSSGSVAAFREFTRRKGDFATAGLAVNATYINSQIKKLALVFFGVANTPVLARDTASQLLDQNITPALIQQAQDSLEKELEVIGDMYAGADMKLHLAKHFLKEAIEEIANQS